jgi:poly(A) polymerase
VQIIASNGFFMRQHYQALLQDLPHWMQDNQLQALHLAVRDAGGQMRLVGGVVRDLMRDMGGVDRRINTAQNWPDDVDIATSLLPKTMMQLAQKLGLKAIPTGIDHGTITVVFAQGTAEITTLRQDIICDGRHAKVRFGTDFTADAQRRDFTMNALYLGFDGTLHDDVGGLDDAIAGRVRFIGEASTRIAEDALRILRFYRFIAQVNDTQIDAAGQQACMQQRALVAGLSAERIQKEWLKLLAQKNPYPALIAMQQAQLFTALHWPDMELDAAYLAATNNALLRLRLLLIHTDKATTKQLIGRLKLSKKAGLYVMQLQPESLPPYAAETIAHGAFIRAHGKALYADALLVRAAYEGLKLPDARLQKWLDFAANFVPAFLPICAADLIEIGYQQGKPLGDMLRHLERAWEQSNYTLTHENLLEMARADFIKATD